MESNFLKDLSNDLANLLVNGDNYDVIIRAGEDPNVKEFRAHFIILGARSTYFRAALSKDWAQKENGIIIFKKPNIPSNIFEIILRYLYTGIVEFDKLNASEILKLFVAVEELDLPKLNDYIQNYIIERQVDFSQEDPVELLQIVIHREKLSSILKTICNQPKKLFESSRFLSLEKSIIIILLKRDDLLIEEIDIWNYLLKWGIAQMKTKLNVENVSKWTEENFVELERILRDCIPLIRWFQIPAKIFWRNLRQFEQLFPKSLYQDILGYIIDPDTPPNSTVILPSRSLSYDNYDSILIEQNHFAIVASWIDKNNQDHYTRSLPYSFNLLYRASKDGFQAQKFHELCDYKGATIMIAKIKTEEKLIGGYNPLDWKPYTTTVNSNGSWQETSDSFLFSFMGKGSKSGNLVRVTNSTHAVSYVVNCGPCFGSGWDLKIENDFIRRIGSSNYSGIGSIISNTHNLEDYEVFQVTKKSN